MSIETSLLTLDIRFQPVAAALVETVQMDLLPLRFPGFKFKVMETKRTLERQEAVLAAGASKNKIGWHNFGLALDAGFFRPDGTYMGADDNGIYRAYGFLAMALGCRWGGNWDQDNIIAEPGENDLGHVEWRPPGVTLDDLIKAAGLVA